MISRRAFVSGPWSSVGILPVIEVIPKVLELLKEIVPRLSRVALFTDQANPGQVVTYDALTAAGQALGIRVQRVDVRDASYLKNAFASVLNQRAQALFAYPLTVKPEDIREIAQFAVINHLPIVTNWEGYAELGFLLYYGARLSDQYRQAGVYIDEILKGARPADLPVEQPSKLALVINLKTAKALGLTIPPAVLARADEIIQ